MEGSPEVGGHHPILRGPNLEFEKVEAVRIGSLSALLLGQDIHLLPPSAPGPRPSAWNWHRRHRLSTSPAFELHRSLSWISSLQTGG